MYLSVFLSSLFYFDFWKLYLYNFDKNKKITQRYWEKKLNWILPELVDKHKKVNTHSYSKKVFVYLDF